MLPINLFSSFGDSQGAPDPSSSLSTISTGLLEHFAMLRRRFPAILAVLGIALLAGIIISALTPQAFVATANLMVDAPGASSGSSSGSGSTTTAAQNSDTAGLTQLPTIQSHTKLLQSDALKAKLAADLDVPVSKVPKIDVTQLAETNLIQISAEAHTPEDAANGANRYAAIYLADVKKGRTQQIDGVYVLTAQAAGDALNSLRELQARQRSFDATYRIADLAASRESQARAAVDMRSRLDDAQQALTNLPARIDSLKARISVTPQYENAAPSPAATDAAKQIPQLESKISDLQAQDADLAKQYAPTYNKRVDLQSQIAQAKSQLAAAQSAAEPRTRQSDAYARLTAQLAQAEAEQQRLSGLSAGLQRQIRDQGSNMDRLSYLLVRDAQLGHEIDNLSANYRVLAQKRDELGLRARQPQINIHLADAAQPPLKPIRPNWTQNLVFAAILGLCLGWLFAIRQDQGDDQIYSTEEAVRILNVPVIGYVPVMPGVDETSHTAIEPRSHTAEFYRRLAATISFAAAGSGNPSPTLVIGSADRREGRSMTIANLASVAAMDGRKVLIVDADMRNPSQHQRFGTPNAPGLADYLAGRAQLEAVLHRTASKNVRLVPSGTSPENPVELLYSPRMPKFIHAARGIADLILFDVPSCDGVIDPAIIASQVDGVLMVVGFGQASRAKYVEAASLLADARAHVIGAIVAAGPDSALAPPRRSPLQIETHSDPADAARADGSVPLLSVDTSKAILPEPQPEAESDEDAAHSRVEHGGTMAKRIKTGSHVRKTSNFVFSTPSNGSARPIDPAANGAQSGAAGVGTEDVLD